MKLNRRGFTLIEVALFLAVTGLLFIGIAVGVQNSIYQQRFNDSIQNFAEFLRSVYAGVMNVQEKNPGGRSERAVYGKLVTFGERYDFAGCPVNSNTITKAGCTNNGKNTIFVYDVVGDIGEVNTGNVVDSLIDLKADVITVTTRNDGTKNVELNGLVESYSPKWAARIEKTNCPNDGDCLFTGSVLVVRHPRSGTVYTLVNDATVNINEKMLNWTGGAMLTSELSNFKLKTVDFCINPEESRSRLRRDVRLVRNARNASGVEIIADEGNPCMTD